MMANERSFLLLRIASPMPKLDEDTQRARREQILDAAQRCFARDGFHNTTMAVICREAGISPGALYLYFKSKEELIEGIVEREKGNLAQDLAAIGNATDFFAALGRLAEAYCLEEPIEKVRMQVEINAEALRNPAVGRIVAEIDRFVVESFQRLLTDAEAEGRIKLVADAATVVQVMTMIGDGLFLRRALNPDFDGKSCMPVILSLIAFLIRPVEAGTEATAGALRDERAALGVS
jgi:TetR/AcrR family transcriptional repressor of uid operon